MVVLGQMGKDAIRINEVELAVGKVNWRFDIVLDKAAPRVLLTTLFYVLLRDVATIYLGIW